MRTRILTQALVILMIGIASPAPAQAPAQPTNAGPVQPWGLPPLPAGVGPVEKFADIHDTPQGQFLEGGSFGYPRKPVVCRHWQRLDLLSAARR